MSHAPYRTWLRGAIPLIGLATVVASSTELLTASAESLDEEALVGLPEPRSEGPASLEEALLRRRSVRRPCPFGR